MNLTQTIVQLVVATAIMGLGIFFFMLDVDGVKEWIAAILSVALIFVGTIMAWSTFHRSRDGAA